MIEFIEQFIRIPEGKAVGQPMKLMNWQLKFLREVFDNPHGTRRAILSIGRKNSKTTLVAALMLAYIVGPVSTSNSQVFSAALSREQAGLLFGLMAKMVRMNPELSQHVVVRDTAKELVCTLNGVKYRALSADANTAMGLSPVCFCYDEAGQVVGPKSDLYTALHTAQGAHAAPIEFVISTQAPTDADFLSLMIDDARTGADPQTVCHVYEAEIGCDLMDEGAWVAANPALGTITSFDAFRKLAEEAKRNPSAQNQFRNLLLNQRISAEGHLFGREDWVRCGGEVDLDVFHEQPVWGGLDLSSRQDLTALVLVARDVEMQWHVQAHFWTPEEGLEARAERDKCVYLEWRSLGLLTATPGRSIDYGWVAQRIGEICDDYDVRGIAFDRWRIEDLKRELAERRIEAPLEPFGQGFKDMGPAVEAVESELANGRVRHGMHPILTWCVSNAKAAPDPTGARKADKRKSSGRIDGAVALIMAMGLASKTPFVPVVPSVYASRGLRFL